MATLLTVNGQIANPSSKIIRRLLIKRRLQTTGLYETDWQDVSDDVIKWGTVKREVDSTRVNQFKFSNITLTMNNETGIYNNSDDESSMWYGYGDQQRTLVKVIVGFKYETLGTDGIWENITINNAGNWDESSWDASNFDEEAVLYSGYLSGDINVVGNNQVNLPIVPLTEVFRQFSASRLTFYNNSLTASEFMTGLRDQQDSSGVYIFRPFFGDTTGNWEISATSVEYANLSTSTGEDITNSTVWDIIQKLSESENHIPMVTGDGKFKFFPRSTSTTTVYEFFGGRSFSSEYGRTIKKINWYGKKFSKYYSRVTVKYRDADTSTSYEIADSNYAVSGGSSPWTQGERTLKIENSWIPTASVAETIADNLFAEFSAIRKEIDFSTTFVPHLQVYDRVLVTYDESPAETNSLWDVYNWGDTTTAAEQFDLIWDESSGDNIKLLDEEFKLIAIDLNLDTCETKFIGRE